MRKAKKVYADRLKIPLVGDQRDFYTKSGTLAARGYTRVVIGERGPYIEFDPKQIESKNFRIPENQEYRIKDKRVYYIEARSKDDSNVKLYYQKRTVKYADYRIGMAYISPFELKTKDLGELIEPI